MNSVYEIKRDDPEWRVGWAVWLDLTSRSGVGNELEAVDTETQIEIIESIGRIAIKALQAGDEDRWKSLHGSDYYTRVDPVSGQRHTSHIAEISLEELGPADFMRHMERKVEALRSQVYFLEGRCSELIISRREDRAVIKELEEKLAKLTKEKEPRN